MQMLPKIFVKNLPLLWANKYYTMKYKYELKRIKFSVLYGFGSMFMSRSLNSVELDGNGLPRDDS